MSDALTAPYAHATEMHDHWWWRPGWRVGRRFYSVFATFENQPELQRLVDSWQQRLALIDGLDMVPHEWRHLTIQGVGFTDEVADADLNAIRVELSHRIAHIKPPRATFGPLAIHPEALVLPAIPQEPWGSIKDAIQDGLASVLGADSLDSSPNHFRPHVTVAYNTLERSPSPIQAIIDSVDIAEAAVTVPDVNLLEMHRDHRMYQWREISRIRFAHQ